ncbi:UDP-N-acetylmuramoyl-tripeptide--D-alanyl-D-alanine ligase [Pseudoleptotrichia goodfellowii]|uniref:UDP-N-acetylmuramoyl-tripeptide--D-alanyl-D-alanine ligase n=2 Tax=Pseudoleptotrichia goodfellowii TaxID=157692 RepID=D0GII6_9FUSO|nr:UDP-N-acetylmuramoyl-tripeptide--D-alanyl-D-alanine ligase [Pseudoleptotrichia goodfellowii]EEY36076.1 UDP-N-acetylmuramoyl-tripeptide--D-alanyl-D-alanine ligase [Pseudoleptotrichia goodfellowii F0264]MBF4805137.1 UDP-N-acetylmuramoyl-tripeptide--D-alanyl-D-alanine ligase [Pseudoleptotrichia goodfellowii]BBM37262.1 UDP-N-acetylmuramoylalanyl-D-glutamyl-2,6-diaminopimelate--D-alanyl-D-alanyl ligase [Pseudoleptotrichia goodfellowii]
MDKNEIFWSIIDNENIDNDLTDINKISMNSKECGKNDLFVAIRGGNNYINEALEKGAYAVYDNAHADIKEEYKNKTFFVNDSVEFLQKFAKKWREALDVKVIGITGSNGKTTVKDITYQLLSSKYKGKKTEGNYNNHIGLPFTLLRLEKDDKFIILEMGMSGFGEIELLGKISNPDISIITNIGESHLEFLHTKENVFKAKTELLPYTKEVLIINGDDDYLKNINESSLKTIKVLRKDSKNIEKSNFYYGNINFDEKGSSFSLEYSEKENEKFQKKLFKTNILGEHNILNLTMAIAVAKQFGIEDKDIEETVKNIKLTDMRFQITEKGNTIYINDAYNASPASMKKSLETFSEIYNDRMKIAVLGDMLELGENELELHSDIYETLRNIKLNKLYLFGERMKSLYDRVKKESQEKNSDENSEVEHFSDKNKIKEKLKEITDEKVILIKGSRGMKLEEIME